jgi:hypothetical protein
MGPCEAMTLIDSYRRPGTSVPQLRVDDSFLIPKSVPAYHSVNLHPFLFNDQAYSN